MAITPPIKKVKNDQIRMISAPLDAPSIFADGFAATIADASTFKLCFYEKIPHEGELRGRFVVNLTLSRAGIKQMQAQLNDIVSQIEADEANSQR